MTPGSHELPIPEPEEDTDFQEAIVDVAQEMDSRRTLRDRIQDAGRTMELCLMLLWRHLGRV
jgi:hypothetical protein